MKFEIEKILNGWIVKGSCLQQLEAGTPPIQFIDSVYCKDLEEVSQAQKIWNEDGPDGILRWLKSKQE